MPDIDQPTTPTPTVTATEKAIHVRCCGFAGETVLGGVRTIAINEALYLELYEVLAREVLSRATDPAYADHPAWQEFRRHHVLATKEGLAGGCRHGIDPEAAPGAWNGAWDFLRSPRTRPIDVMRTIDRIDRQLVNDASALDRALRILEGNVKALTERVAAIDNAAIDKVALRVGAVADRVGALERSLEKLASNVDVNLTPRIQKLDADAQTLRARVGTQSDRLTSMADAMTNVLGVLGVLQAADIVTRLDALTGRVDHLDNIDLAAPPEIAQVLELVRGQQDQIDVLQGMLAARPTEAAPAAPERDLATRDYVDEAIRKLAATIRQYVRDHVKQALAPRPSTLQRLWGALRDRAPAPAPAAASGASAPAVPTAVIEQAEQALRRDR